MTENDVKICLGELKNKKCEGFDRIPVCMLLDANVKILPPMAYLFNAIYQTCKIPDQWKVAKIVPIFKKGSKVQIENYRPIANLCSASKVFEKLILKEIQFLENKNKLDLNGKQQHGFKRKKSTATAGALLQSLIALAVDENFYVVMASLDLSMAFNMINTELLVRRLRIMGMPTDLIMYYQISLQLRKTLNEIFESCTSEHAALLNNVVCTRRQLKFEVIRSYHRKIGMNAIKNKFYHITNLIGLDLINLSFVHFKRMMKIQL